MNGQFYDLTPAQKAELGAVRLKYLQNREVYLMGESFGFSKRVLDVLAQEGHRLLEEESDLVGKFTPDGHSLNYWTHDVRKDLLPSFQNAVTALSKRLEDPTNG